jgi:hypothetical protein
MNRFGGFVSADKSYVLALLVCERSITEAGTAQKTLIGILNGVTGAQLPLVIQRLVIYVEILPAPGDVGPFYIGLFAPSGNPIVKSALQTPQVPPGVGIHVEIPLNGITFGEEGDYSLEVFVEERNLMRRIFSVKTAPPPQEERVDLPTS